MSKTLIVSSMGCASNAKQVGIRIGDTILSYNGVLIHTNSELLKSISATNEIDVSDVELIVLRNGKELKFVVVLNSEDMHCTETSEPLPPPSKIITRSQASDSATSFVSFLG